MMESIGLVELSSIAKGIETADAILKAASVRLIYSRPICPGKYCILFAGQVAAVKASMDAAMEIGGVFVLDSVVIPNIHQQVIKAISLATPIHIINALGIIEFFCITAAIHAADAAVKSADVELIEVRLGTGIGGKSYVTLTGEVAAVRESIQSGISAENVRGLVVSSVVIPHAHEQLCNHLM